METEETITLTKEEYDSRMSTVSKVSASITLIVVGLIAVYNAKKEERYQYWGIVGAGVLFIIIALIFRKIDKMK